MRCPSASAIGAKLLAATSQLGYLDGSEALPVSVSIGAVVGSLGERLQHVLAAAELACKRAKADGGGRVAVTEELGDVDARCDSPGTRGDASFARRCKPISSSSRRSRSSSLHARGAQTVGYELLVRLRNSAGELLAPDKFLEACAQYGLLPALDRWVLCAAVEALRPHAQSLATSSLFFAVNVSAQSLESRKYAAFALETLAAARFAGEPVLLRDQGERGRQPARRRRCSDPGAHQGRRQGRARRLRLRA